MNPLKRRGCRDCLGSVGPDCDDPMQMVGLPIGMFHCGWCGVMQIAGVPHINCTTCDGKGYVEAIPREKENKT